MNSTCGSRGVQSLLGSAFIRSHLESLKTKNTEDTSSLCYLLRHKFSQSTNIRLGNQLETVFNLYVSNHTAARNMRDGKNKKGCHQRDFLCEFDNAIIYAEFKSNIRLDTEKRRATTEKINEVAEEIRRDYPDKVVKPYLVSLRYLKKEDIPPVLSKMYPDVSLIGISDLFENVLKCPLEELSSENSYSEFLTTIAEHLEQS